MEFIKGYMVYKVIADGGGRVPIMRTGDKAAAIKYARMRARGHGTYQVCQLFVDGPEKVVLTVE